jgi:enterochelin esterase-like enzyme
MMARYFTASIFALLTFSGFTLTGAEPAPAAGARNGVFVSPEILPDQRVTFRLRAPKATAVTVSGQIQRTPAEMTKDETGVWSVTVGPLAPELYEYSFNIDGLAIADPANRLVKPTRSPRMSILDLPGNPPLLHDFQNVPHGKISLQWYLSKSLGTRRPLQVYTPPGYEAEPKAHFPTLYLFHGTGDNEAMWTGLGRAHWILDNLIAQRRAQPMIIVMPDCHAIPPGSGSPQENLDAFERDLLQDLMPFVEANYRTQADADHRALIGVSMGGGQSLIIGLKHPDRFAWIGGMSSAPTSNGPFDDAVALLGDDGALKASVKLIWFACGKEDRLVVSNRRLDDALSSHGIPHQFVEVDGGHAWPVWRKNLAQFAPLLFQPGK